MKNKYVADINDFRKYGLIRALLTANGLTCGVFWLLTADDTSNDGELVQYLKKPAWGERLDPELFLKLKHLVHIHKDRTVARVRQEELLPRTKYFEDRIPDDARSRATVFNNGLTHLKDCDLVFFDPDNGLEIQSKPCGRKDSNKYIYFKEVSATYNRGHSLLIYQHFPREDRAVYIKRRAEQLTAATGCKSIFSFTSGYVCFFLVPQQNHKEELNFGVAAVQSQWKSQFSMTLHSN